MYYILKKVGPDYKTTHAGLRHPTCNEECPSACSNQWEYTEDGRWHVDVSMNVSCGILFNITLPLYITYEQFLVTEVKINRLHLNLSF